MRRLFCATASVAALCAGVAHADLVIDIPDVPEFTLTDPIVSDEDVIINALPGTLLIIDTRIEAQTLTINAGLSGVQISDSAEFQVEGDIIIDSGGFAPTEPLGPGEVVAAVGDITLTAAAPQRAVVIVDGAASGGNGATSPSSLAAAEVPIALTETDQGILIAVLDASTFAPLEVDLGGGGLASDSRRMTEFTARLFSCPQADPDARFAEGTCAWASAGADRLESDRGAADFDDLTWSFAMGAQTEVAEHIFLGGALAYDSSRTSTAATQRDARTGRAGAAVKYDDGAFSAGLAVAIGYGAGDQTRTLATGAIAEGGTDTFGVEARARVGYGLTFGELAVEPSAAVSVAHLRQDGFAETGPSLSARRVAATDLTSMGLHAGLTLGTDFIAGPFDTRLLPELSLGLDWYADPDVRVTATGATGRPLFQDIEPDALTGTVGLGLTVFAAQDIALRLRYAGRFGENTVGHGGEAKLTLGF